MQRNAPAPNPWLLLGALTVLAALFPLAARALQPSSSPTNLVAFQDKVYFFATNSDQIRSVWRYDAVSDSHRMLGGLLPMADMAMFEGGILATDRHVFVLARTSSEGMTLFRVNDDATDLVALHLFPMMPQHRAVFLGSNSRFVFIAVAGGALEREAGLWRSDGTREGTLCLTCGTDYVLFDHSTPGDDGTLYFSSPLHDAIVATDGTVGSTRYLASGTFSSVAMYLPGRLLAGYHDAETGIELGAFDPETGELIERFDQCPGPCEGLAVGNFARFGDRALFAANDGVHGTELWITDGTDAGTRMVKDINPGASGSDPYRFTPVGNLAYFTAVTAEHGRELWVTDGTPDGTQLVADINPGLASAEPYAFAVVGDRLFFSADDGEHGEELWVTSPFGVPRLVRDIYPGEGSSSPHGTVATAGAVVFGARHPATGRELWRSDGHRPDTRLAADIWSQPNVNPGSRPRHLTPAGDKLYFVLNDLEHGAELWVTEGLPEDARMVKDIFPGPASADPHNLTFFNGKLYFAADDGIHGIELWQTDGTESGTGLVADIGFQEQSGAPRELTVDPANKRLYFVANGSHPGIHYVDAARSGLNLIAGSRLPNPEWNPTNLTIWGGALYFTADDGIHGEELWYSDGYSVWLYRDFVSEPVEMNAPDMLTPFDDFLFFTGTDAVGQRRLFSVPQIPGEGDSDTPASME